MYTIDAKANQNLNQKNVFEYQINKQNLIKFLGITKEELSKSIKDGKSYVEIARKKGISEQQLSEYLKKEISQELEKQYKQGKINYESYKYFKRDINDLLQQEIHFKLPIK